MSKEFPLYPDLSEEGEKEADLLIKNFKEKLKITADEVIGELYVNVMPYIKSDSWTNFRNHMMDGFRNYHNSKIQGEYDFKHIRAEIFKEFKNEIIKDLDKDSLEEIEELKRRLEYYENFNRK